jgi:glycosyltransferase involved in cell wall biosynthesis
MLARQIFINGRFLTKTITGTERFAMEMTLALDALLGEQIQPPSVTILAPKGASRPSALSTMDFKICGTHQGHLWEQWELPQAARHGLLLNFTNSGPVLQSKQVVVIHDALVFRWPENYTFFYRSFHQLLGRILAHRATIMTVSTFSQHELATVFKLPISKLRVLSNGHEHLLERKADETVLDRLKIRDQSFFMVLGSPSPTKNHARAIEAFQHLNRSDIKLVIVGSAKATIFRSEAKGSTENIIMAGRLSDEEIVSLYRHAVALLFPSLYEGFGIPPLEAMTQGCPVIASHIPPIKEVCGEAALYFNPMNPLEMAEKMREMLNNSAQREALIQQGRERYLGFSWKKSARQLLDSISV